MKKAIIVIICITLIAVMINIYLHNQNEEINKPYSLDDFKEKLKPGLYCSDVVDIFGVPDRSYGEHFLIPGYFLDDGNIIKIDFESARTYIKGYTILTGDSTFGNEKVIDSIEFEILPEDSDIKYKKAYSLNEFDEKLRYNMKYTEVVDIFGEPDLFLGSGRVIVGYILDDGRVVALNFGGGSEGIERYTILEEGAVSIGQKVIGSVELKTQGD